MVEFEDRLDELIAIQTSSGFEFPSNLTDQLFATTYGQELWEKHLIDVFGCPDGEDGEVMDCKYTMNRFTTAKKWTCNTQYGFTGAPLTDPEIGPIYPLELHKENCEDLTLACHCQDASWVFGNNNIHNGLPEIERTYRQAGRDYWGQFIRNGTFPENNAFGEMKNIKELDG